MSAHVVLCCLLGREGIPSGCLTGVNDTDREKLGEVWRGLGPREF